MKKEYRDESMGFRKGSAAVAVALLLLAGGGMTLAGCPAKQADDGGGAAASGGQAAAAPPASDLVAPSNPRMGDVKARIEGTQNAPQRLKQR